MLTGAKKFLLLLTLVGGASTAHAGWVGGGGRFIQDADNPWFIQNTPLVNYCIKVDEANFGLPIARLRTLSAEAFQFWKKQVASIQQTSFQTMQGATAIIKVATQVFREVGCNDNPELVLQFGVLDQPQRDFLGDPTDFAAVSIRTDYDPVNLKGKGFIYLSPQSGPLRLKESRMSQPWTTENGALAQIFLAHELGHVFGFQHDDTFLMTSQITDLLQRRAVDVPYLSSQFRKMLNGPDLLFGVKMYEYQTSGRPDLYRSLWGSAGEDTVSYALEDGVFKVSAWNNGNGSASKRLIGQARLVRKDFGPQRTVGYFWFPPQQAVFPGFVGSGTYWYGSTPPPPRYEGEYRSLDGSVSRTIKVSVLDAHNYFDVGGEFEGKPYISFSQGL